MCLHVDLFVSPQSSLRFLIYICKLLGHYFIKYSFFLFLSSWNSYYVNVDMLYGVPQVFKTVYFSSFFSLFLRLSPPDLTSLIISFGCSNMLLIFLMNFFNFYTLQLQNLCFIPLYNFSVLTYSICWNMFLLVTFSSLPVNSFSSLSIFYKVDLKSLSGVSSGTASVYFSCVGEYLFKNWMFKSLQCGNSGNQILSLLIVGFVAFMGSNCLFSDFSKQFL